jgi:F-type H+-transporting ATPase subunit delta
MSSNLIAKRYARGFLKLLEAEGEPLEENFARLLHVSNALFSDKEIAKFFHSPANLAASKISILNDVLALSQNRAEKLSKFLERLVLAGRVGILPQVCDEFKSLIDLKSGVIRAEVVSAHELDESEKTSIEQKLLLKLGKKLETQFLIDKSLLAGVIVKIGHRSFDVSVQANLNELAVATQL